MDNSSDYDTTSFSILEAGASTPMNLSFLSPIKKFDNLNLNISPEHPNNNANSDDYNNDSDNNSVGNQTITNDSDSGSDIDVIDKPMYINKRKRNDVSDIDMLTPRDSNDNTSTSMSICQTGHSTNSNNNITSTSLSNLKLSFSNSDSTPCPVPPKKKLRLKFKADDETPLPHKRKTNLFDFSNSKKTSVANVPIYDDNNGNEGHFHDDFHEDHDDFHDDHDASSPIPYNQSTPISQSTPANSRPTSPGPDAKSEATPSQSSYVEGEVINGYPMLNETPQSTLSKLKTSYHINSPKYQIIGDLPKSSVGVMDESDQDVHIADKRINDPYVNEPKDLSSNLDVRNNYMDNKYKLPVLKQLPEPISETIHLINNDNVLEFYTYIKLQNEDLVLLLKRERVKWHPDKWVNDKLPMELVNAVSLSINSLIEIHS